MTGWQRALLVGYAAIQVFLLAQLFIAQRDLAHAINADITAKCRAWSQDAIGAPPGCAKYLKAAPQEEP